MADKSEGKHMHPEDFEGLIAGLRSVADYKRGKREGFVTHVPTRVDGDFRQIAIGPLQQFRSVNTSGFPE